MLVLSSDFLSFAFINVVILVISSVGYNIVFLFLKSKNLFLTFSFQEMLTSRLQNIQMVYFETKV